MSWYIQEQEPVYVDNNATTQIDDRVQQRIVDAMKNLWANPSSAYEIAQKSKDAVDEARKNMGEMLHVPKDGVTFTSGGTEANALIIHVAMKNVPRGVLPHIVTTSLEHPSIIEPLKYELEQNNIELTVISPDPKTGKIDSKSISDAVKSNTVLVTVQLVNNETGLVQPLTDISRAVRETAKRRDVHLAIHSDVAQAIGRLDVNLYTLDVDAVTIVGHKFYGPRIGALVIRQDFPLKFIPMFRGGNQENGRRAGTENTPMIVGLGEAARLVVENLREDVRKIQEVRNYFEEKLKEELKDTVNINFADRQRLPNFSSVAVKSFDGTAKELLEKCKSFISSYCAACHSTLDENPSSALTECGLSIELSKKCIRFSFGRRNTKEDVDRIIKELKAMTFFSKFGSSLLNQINLGPTAGF
ncbi:hypothetical protein WR25_15441 [Diploscapter pachys]|uniref:Selenocysteine lyase n=1 Tax=Diploscapter pachys TaxID=2018661 RepID=A0A2A2JF43_9BILA|nr:hypothetical protein WR25_15441 [Diploscapter pachys]